MKLLNAAIISFRRFRLNGFTYLSDCVSEDNFQIKATQAQTKWGEKGLLARGSNGGVKEGTDVHILMPTTDFNPKPCPVYALGHHLRKNPGSLPQGCVKRQMMGLIGTTRVMIFPFFLQAVNDPDEEPVAFVVLIDIIENKSQASGLSSQPAAPHESWKTPFRRTLDCFTRCFG